MKEILEILNLPEDVKTDLGKADTFTADQLKAAVEAHNKSLFAQHRDALSNDESFVKSFHDKGHSKAMADQRARILQAMKGSGFDGLVEDSDGVIPTVKIVERYVADLVEKGKGKNKGNEELEGKLTDANRMLNELKKSIEDGSHSSISDARRELAELKARIADDAGRNWLTSHLKKTYAIPKPEATILIAKRITDAGLKYGPFGENGAMTIVDSAGNKVRNQAGDRVMTLDDIISGFEDGLVVQSNGGNGGTKKDAEGGTGTMKISPIIEKRLQAAQDALDAATKVNRG